MFHFCNLAKALGDENRVRILMALRKYPLCVCQLTALLDLAPSITSKHLYALALWVYLAYGKRLLLMWV